MENSFKLCGTSLYVIAAIYENNPLMAYAIVNLGLVVGYSLVQLKIVPIFAQTIIASLCVHIPG